MGDCLGEDRRVVLTMGGHVRNISLKDRHETLIAKAKKTRPDGNVSAFFREVLDIVIAAEKGGRKGGKIYTLWKRHMNPV